MRKIIGKFGRSAAKQIFRDVHQLRIHGKLPNINSAEEKQIIEKTKEVFGDSPSFTEYEFEKKVLNPLRIRKNDFLSHNEVDQIDKGLNLKDHTNRIEDAED